MELRRRSAKGMFQKYLGSSVQYFTNVNILNVFYMIEYK